MPESLGLLEVVIGLLVVIVIPIALMYLLS
jgi:hypothetical protein